MSIQWRKALQGPMLLQPEGVGLLEQVNSDESVYLDKYAEAKHHERDDDEYVAYSVTPDGAAVIDVSGMLVHRLGIDGHFLGMQGYDGVERQVLKADADPRVSWIVLDTDSPGGTVSGIGEASRVIMEASKPTIALVNELAASGAYWLACACDEIVAIEGADVGSIGVLRIHVNAEGAFEAMGLDHTVFKAGERKDTGSPYRAITSGEAEEIQADLNDTYERFVSWVSTQRSVDPAVVRNTEARVLDASGALAIGLIDRIVTKDEVLTAPAIRGMGSIADEGGIHMANQAGRENAADFETKLEAERAQWEAEQATKMADAVQAALQQERDAVAAQQKAESERVSAILGLEEASGREKTASLLAAKGVSADDAQEILASMPASYVAQQEAAGGVGLNVDSNTHEGDQSATSGAPAASIAVKGM